MFSFDLRYGAGTVVKAYFLVRERFLDLAELLANKNEREKRRERKAYIVDEILRYNYHSTYITVLYGIIYRDPSQIK